VELAGVGAAGVGAEEVIRVQEVLLVLVCFHEQKGGLDSLCFKTLIFGVGNIFLGSRQDSKRANARRKARKRDRRSSASE
jgi:hypothetical protein